LEIDNIAIFLDTNIALHYKRLDQVDWCSEFGADEVTFIIGSVFLAELEKHKVENISKKIRKRAGDYAGWLLKKFEDPIVQEKVLIQFHPREPMIDFAEYRLDHRIADDRLIASVIEYQIENGEQDCHVFTADIGLTLKLKMLKISVLTPNVEHLLPESISEEEKENKELRAQLAKFMNRHPNISLSFAAGDSIFEMKMPTFPDRGEFILPRMQVIRNKFPELKTDLCDEKLAALANSPQMLQIGKAIQSFSFGIDRSYNAQLHAFFSEYAGYLEDFYAYGIRWGTMVKIDLRLSNLLGSAAATNIDIYLTCDAPARLMTKEQRPSPPKAPPYPEKPSVLGLEKAPILISTVPQYDFQRGAKVRDLSEPTLEVVNGKSVHCVSQLKHRQSLDLIPVWMDFGAGSPVRNLKIKYEIHATEIIDPVCGELRLRILGD
jgi:rRNA-processing protein FCF1